MFARKFLCALVLSLTASCAFASHFRGGIITWKPASSSPGKVDFSFKVAWRRSAFSPFCNDTTISSSQLIGTGDSWSCYSGCSGSIASTQFRCTGYSEMEDWIQGDNTFEYTFTGQGPFVITFTGCCWISTLVKGKDGNWAVPVTVDLTVRKDTGKINSSPISATAPIIRLQQNCTYSLPVHTDDPDGDTVKCRWATNTGSVDECGGICGALTSAVLDENPCVIHYTASTLGWHAVSLILEDFPDPRVSSSPMSAVPLQFLLYVEARTSGATCGSCLRYANETLTDNECVTVEPTKSFSTRIVVETDNCKLSEVLLVSPIGLTKSVIAGSNLSRYVDASWTPQLNQNGSHVFCFSAMDSLGIALEQRCITILAGVHAPSLIHTSLEPKNGSLNVDVFTRKFTMAFDQETRRPTESKYITVLSLSNNYVIAKLDTLSSSEVLISNSSLTFYLPVAGSLFPNTVHYVSMDRGAVVGLQACASSGSPFEGFQDQLTWSFSTGPTTEHPCATSKQGPCQRDCDYDEVTNTYHCSCNDNEILAPNRHTCLPQGKLMCSNNCSGNGVCLGNDVCDCQFGWEGDDCLDPVCYNFAGCSSHGVCLSPNVCGCRYGWGGPACSVDRCSVYRSCSSCTAVVGCGWCDETLSCIPGFGSGPDDLSCSSWHYYDNGCLAAASSSQSQTIACSNQVKTLDCGSCRVANPPRTEGPGSLQYCTDFEKSCNSYASCFSLGSDSCLTWDENVCPLGRPAKDDSLSRRRRRQTKDGENGNSNFNPSICRGDGKANVLEAKASGEDVVEVTVKLIADSGIFLPDHGLLRKIAWVESKDGSNSNTFRDISEEAGVGMWQIDKTTFESLREQFLTTTKKRKQIYNRIKEKFGIDMAKVTRADLYKPLVAALYARVRLFVAYDPQTKTFPPIPESNEAQAAYWKKYYNTDNGKGTTQKFLDDVVKIPKSSPRDDGCVKGIRDVENDCKCLCDNGYRGKKCDQPHCGCSLSPCSNNGRCVEASDGTVNHYCQCYNRWQGPCCDRLPPRTWWGDPHLQTIDGVEFDYFDIGVYWGCISRVNDFAVQLAFFRWKGTSLVGGVALKTGTSTVTVVSTRNVTGLPLFRINGTETVVSAGKNITLSQGDVTLFVSNDSASGYLVFFFQYRNGITYAVETHYSAILGFQYLNVALGPSLVLQGKTAGLCGIADGRTENDFTGPDGTIYPNSTAFGNSWRIRNATSLSDSWSWNSSNFYPPDVSGIEYTDPGHVPQYDLSGYSLIDIQNAEQVCVAKGLSGTFLDSCKLDVVVTGDVSFANQSAFQRGKCPNDCSNHGMCINGNCSCFALWSGGDCSEGGCSSCPLNSDCLNGFCVCKLGYFKQNEQCIKASCAAVNDCTSPAQGICKDTNECLCSPGFTSPNCSQIAVCTVPCSPQGVCGEGNQCICNPNWSGADCSIPDCGDLQNCSDNGVCNANASCDCFPGWTGSSCSLPSCRGVSECSGNGQCIGHDQCSCSEGFAPPNCSLPLLCPSLSNCSGNGVCLTSASCSCYTGYTGSSCEFPLCPSGCSNQGRCTGANFCQCNQGWTGLSCSEPSCEAHSFCSGHGVCKEFDLCVCNTNWTGPACDVPYCPTNTSLQCFGKGICIGPGICSCDSGYSGDLCQEKAYNPVCNNSWSVQHDLWIECYEDWTNGSAQCPLLGEQAAVSSSSAQTTPFKQWNAAKTDFINSLQSWLKVASRIPDMPTAVPLDESKTAEEQWNALEAFMDEVNELWYKHIGGQFGFSKPLLPSGECENSQIDKWNQHVSTGKDAKEKADDAFAGSC